MDELNTPAFLAASTNTRSKLAQEDALKVHELVRLHGTDEIKREMELALRLAAELKSWRTGYSCMPAGDGFDSGGYKLHDEITTDIAETGAFVTLDPAKNSTHSGFFAKLEQAFGDREQLIKKKIVDKQTSFFGGKERFEFLL